MRVAQEEIFGPVVSVISFKDEDDLIKQANDTIYGLSAGIWTQNITRAHRFAKEIKAGVVWINTYNMFNAASPFGGYKQSGYGREMGRHALDLYTQVKSVWVDLSGRPDWLVWQVISLRRLSSLTSPEMNVTFKEKPMFALKKAAVFLVLIGGTLLLTACPSQTNIAKINADPGRYRGKEVGIVGTVTDSYGAMGAGAYEIDDGTGKIWVATRRGIPSKGSRVGAKGYVHNGFSFGGRSYGTVLEETDRRARGR